MSVLVAVIIGAGVALPVVLEVISGSGVSGTAATVLDLVPLFIGLLLLVALARPLMRRVR